MYEYECEIVRVVDGDTIDTTVSLGFDTYIRGSSGRIRLYGVDTPETRSRDAEEKKYGLAAKAFVVNFFDNADQVILKTWENGKCISTNTPEKTTQSGREEEKKSFRDDDFDKLMLFDEYVDGVECFGYFFHSKKHDDFSFGVYEIYLSDEFRTEISLKLKPSEFLEQGVDMEQFKSYLHENIEKGQYDFSEPRKIWEKYTCRYQSKVDETGTYVSKYTEEELTKIEQEEYLTPIEWTRRFCNWKELKQRKFNVQTYDD